ncbi:MAG: hypothetical protein HVN35_09595 [Methanobacteriaceae archaeon]|nr:hypothetical protein [Methanobacteriaceae archaeon]
MRKNLGLLSILAVVIVVVAVSGCSNNTNTTSNSNVNAINEKSTKLSLTNNGTTWLQVELVANGTAKNGTNRTIYAETFIKPNGTATIDLSQILGYGNEPLPAGTTIRIQSWKGLFNNTNGVGTNGTINLTLQGWSNTLNPGPKDNSTNINFSPVPIYQLPANINDTTVFIATTPEELAKITPYDTADQEPVFEEEVLIVNADGTVTIIVTRPPELCRLIAAIV